jgi:beta-1,4-mannosyltransferase
VIKPDITQDSEFTLRNDGSSPKCRIASTPASSGANPYIDLFYRALRPHGIELVGECQINDRWLRKHAGKLDAIHLHWPEGKWRHARKKLGGKLRGVVGLWRFLLLCRRLGVRVIWTVHNLAHHEGVDLVDGLGYRVLAWGSDLLICHSNWAKKEVEKRWRRIAKRTVLMYHGNYDGVYPSPRPREQILTEFGLNPGTPIVCFVGNLRLYKGIDLAIEAVRSLGGKVQLIVAGNPHPEFNMGQLHFLANGLDYIKIVPGFLSHQHFSDIVSVSEAVLLPYHKITGSGALLAALSLGRGVIASDLPYFREVLEHEKEAGVLVNTHDTVSFGQSILSYLGKPREIRNGAALNISQMFSWPNVIKALAPRLLRLTSTSRR